MKGALAAIGTATTGGILLDAFVTSGETRAPGGAKISKRQTLNTVGEPIAVAWSPDSASLAAASNYGQNITVWDADGKVVSQFTRVGRGPSRIRSLAFINGGSQLAFFRHEGALPNICFDVWDVSTGKIISEIANPLFETGSSYIEAEVFGVSANQRLFAVAPVGSTVITYETENWRPLQVIRFDGLSLSVVTSLCFFSDNKRIAAGFARGGVALFDGVSGGLIADLRLFSSEIGDANIAGLAVSPDGDFIAAGTGLISINGPYYGRPEMADWRASLDTVSVWRVKDGSKVASYRRAARAVMQMLWDPKGRYVIFFDDDATLHFWDPHSGGSTATRIALPNPILAMALTVSGNKLAVANRLGVSVFEIS